LGFRDASTDFVLTSPPYYGALDYARDNRLRLWFLGLRDWQSLNARLTSRASIYECDMKACLREMRRVLKPGKYCVLIVGEVQRNGKTKDTAAVLGGMAEEVGFTVDCVIDDEIPDIRRSRRGTKTTRIEKILVLRRSRGVHAH
jgi:DNA modification methylase